MKKHICRILATIVLVTMIPIKAYSYGSSLIKTIDLEMGTPNWVFNSATLRLGLDDNGNPVTISNTVTGLRLNGTKGEDILPGQFDDEDLLKVANWLNAHNNSNTCTDMAGIQPYHICNVFNVNTPKSGNDFEIFRDCLVKEFIDRMYKETDPQKLTKMTQLINTQQVYNFSNATEIIKQDPYMKDGFEGIKELAEDKTKAFVTNKANAVTTQDNTGISTQKWDENKLYESTKNVLKLSTNKEADKWSNTELVVGSKDYFCPDTNKRSINYVPGNDARADMPELTNAIIYDILNTDKFSQVEKLQLLSIVYQNGSIYAYNSSNSIDEEIIKSVLQDNITSSGAEEQIKAISKRIDDLLSKSNIEDDNSKSLLTVGLRMQYGYYLMQTESNAKPSTADTLTFVGGDKLRTVDPIPIIFPKISNMRGYVMMNDVTNEIAYTGEVVLPILGQIDSTEQLSSSGNLKQLKYLKSAYDAVSFIRDKAQLKPDNAYEPVMNEWTKKIEYKDKTGATRKMSLAELFTKLSKMGADFDNLGDYKEDDSKPMRKFFDLSKPDLNTNVKIGIALSSTYIPFKTNVYETSTYRLVNGKTEFLDFHSKYGYYRKALYIDSNIASATERYTTGRTGTLKLATLKSVLECEKDVTLYTDDNFYNANKVKSYREEALQKQGKDEKDDTSLWDKLQNAFKINLEDVLKTNDVATYPSRLKDLSTYGETKKDNFKSGDGIEQAVMGGKDIDYYLNDGKVDESYTVMRGLAVTSSIYRDKDIFTKVLAQGIKPVFISSKSMAKIDGADTTWKDSIFNYAILKNIESNMNVNYTSNLDLNKPLYMDIYGNIVTESGYIVIPIASNATLNKIYNPYTAGFLTTYGKKYYIPESYKWLAESPIKDIIANNKDKKRLELSSTKANDLIDLNNLSTSDEKTLEELFSLYIADFNVDNFDIDTYICNVMLEVLRGAPLENTNKIEEKLVVGGDITKNAVEQAAKLDVFKNSLDSKGTNAILALPNLAYCEWTSYVIFFLYKVSLMLVIVQLLKHIFTFAVKKQFSIKAILKMMFTITLTIGFIFIIPLFFSESYYESNKLLLQNESNYIAMLNLEKREAGIELGVSSTSAPSTKSKIYLKMKEVKMPKYDLFSKITQSSINSNLEKVMKDFGNRELLAGEESFQFLNGAYYEDINDLFDSAIVTFNPNYKLLYTVTLQKTPSSFYTPYYIFLKGLVDRSNVYNIKNNVYAYSTQTYKEGEVKSLGLIKPYLDSDEFINGKQPDVLFLNDIYERENLMTETNCPFLPEDLEKIRSSNWHVDNISDKDYNQRLDKMNTRARDFVIENKELLGRISDETFLKIMSLDLAIYYNKIFNISSANCLDLFNMTSEDITRLAVAPRLDVMKTSPLSYSRFTLEEGGEMAVYTAAIYEMVNFVAGWLKIILPMIVFLVIFSSLFVYKIMLNKKTDSVKGYLWIVSLLCITNPIYALLLKLSMYLPRTGMTVTFCLLIQILLQISVLLVMFYITSVTVMNWKDLGSAKFTKMSFDLASKFRFLKDIPLFKRLDKKIGGDEEDQKEIGWRTYHRLHQTDKSRSDLDESENTRSIISDNRTQQINDITDKDIQKPSNQNDNGKNTHSSMTPMNRNKMNTDNDIVSNNRLDSKNDKYGKDDDTKDITTNNENQTRKIINGKDFKNRKTKPNVDTNSGMSSSEILEKYKVHDMKINKKQNQTENNNNNNNKPRRGLRSWLNGGK